MTISQEYVILVQVATRRTCHQPVFVAAPQTCPQLSTTCALLSKFAQLANTILVTTSVIVVARIVQLVIPILENATLANQHSR